MRLALATALLLAATSAFAAPKTYQVTGEILDVSDTKIVVSKAGEKFEIERSPSAKVTGEIKKGGKATVYYSMTAQEIEAKDAKPAKKK